MAHDLSHNGKNVNYVPAAALDEAIRLESKLDICTTVDSHSHDPSFESLHCVDAGGLAILLSSRCAMGHVQSYKMKKIRVLAPVLSWLSPVLVLV